MCGLLKEDYMVAGIWLLFKIGHISREKAIHDIERLCGFSNARQTVELWEKHWSN